MTLDSRKVAGRIKLRFADLDEMLEYAKHLVSLGTRQLGNWSLGQTLQHLALIQNASIDGFPTVMAWPIRLILRLFLKKWLLRYGVPPSGPNVKTLVAEPIEPAAALANLRAATERVKQETKRAPNPGFGNLSLEEWNALYLRHAELHLSFCVPLGES